MTPGYSPAVQWFVRNEVGEVIYDHVYFEKLIRCPV
jgi:hypothetical protein